MSNVTKRGTLAVLAGCTALGLVLAMPPAVAADGANQNKHATRNAADQVREHRDASVAQLNLAVQQIDQGNISGAESSLRQAETLYRQSTQVARDVGTAPVNAGPDAIVARMHAAMADLKASKAANAKMELQAAIDAIKTLPAA